MRAPIPFDIAAIAAVAWLLAKLFATTRRPAPMRITRARRSSLRQNRYRLPGERS